MNLTAAPRDKKPPRRIVLPASAFADTWQNKPATEAAIGLRFLSQKDLDDARREAEREAAGFYREFRDRSKGGPSDETLEDVYNDVFLTLVVARGACNPNDIGQPYFAYAEDMVKVALTPEALRRIWDELVILHKGSLAARASASDEDVKRLARILPRVTLDVEARKLCAYLIEKIGPQPNIGDEDEDEDTEEDGPYYAVAG